MKKKQMKRYFNVLLVLMVSAVMVIHSVPGNITSVLAQQNLAAKAERANVQLESKNENIETPATAELPAKRPRYLLAGEGTSSSPYLITNEADLRNVWQMGASAYFRLTRDIKLTSEWSPLGVTSSTPFTGYFDGNGYTISNILVSKGSNVGFFGFLSKATIKDLTLENVSLQGNSSYMGALAAAAQAGTLITNCKVIDVTAKHTDTVTAGCIGGLVGYLDTSTIQSSSIESVNITYALSNYVGGLAGYLNGSTVENSYVENATISGATTTHVGGFSGYIASSTVKTSYITHATLKNANNVNTTGGFTGYAISSAISKSYAVKIEISGDYATATNGIGGFAGLITSGSIQQCFSSGTLDLPKTQAYAGGFVGRITTNAGAIFNIVDCFTTCDVKMHFNNSSSNYYVGGFAGYISTAIASGNATYYSTISRIYSSGNVTANYSAGLVGYITGLYGYNYGANYHYVSLTNSLTLSPTVTTSMESPYRITQGLGSYATLTNNYALNEGKYYDNKGTEFRDATQEYPDLKSGMSISAIDAKRQITYQNQTKWDFDAIWAIDEDESLPYLRFAGNIVAPDLPPTEDEETKIPGKPTKLTLEEVNNQLVLSWNKVPGAFKYEVFINGKATETTATQLIVKESLALPGDITVTVAALNSAGSGPRSMELSVQAGSSSDIINQQDPENSLLNEAYIKEIKSSSTMNASSGIANAYDNNLDTSWAGAASDAVTTIDLEFKGLVTFNELYFNEFGNRIQAFTASYWDSGKSEWVVFQEGGKLGANLDKYFNSFGKITTAKVRFEFKRLTSQNSGVALNELALRYK